MATKKKLSTYFSKVITYFLYLFFLLTLVILNFIKQSEAEKYEKEYTKLIAQDSRSVELFEELYAKEDSILILTNRIEELITTHGKKD